MMIFLKKYSFILFIGATLIACGEDALYSKTGTQQIKQNIYIVPEFFTGNVLTNYSTARVQTIEIGQTIKFWASLSINGEIINNDQITSYPLTVEWSLNEESYNLTYFTKTFSKSGSYDVILTTVDFFKDTLRDTVTIQVNQPIKIKAVYPANGYNLLDVTDSAGISLHWEYSGNDSWEKLSCLFYASRTKETTWSHFIDTVKCDQAVSILGPFEIGSSISYGDTSIAYYWGIKIITDKGLFLSQRDSTDIFSFRTRLKENPLSIIEVPIKHQFIDHNKTPLLRVDLISATGDLLDSKESILSEDTFLFKGIEPQNGLIVKATHLSLPEFKAPSITMNVFSGSYNVTPTIIFTDSIAPERAPLVRTLTPEDSIVFKLKDLGSGVNPRTIKVILDEDTLKYVFSDTLLSFLSPKSNQCHPQCLLKVEAGDFATNYTSYIHWTISLKENSLILEGPFPLKDLQ